MSWQQVYNVARREYVGWVRTKGFIISTLMLPAFMLIWVAIIPLITRTDVAALDLALLDTGTGIAAALGERLEQFDAPEVTVTEVTQVSSDRLEAERQRLSDLVRAEELDGYLVVEPDERQRVTARYYAQETSNPVFIGRLEGTVRSTALEDWLAGSGIDPDRIAALQGWDLAAVTISAAGEEAGGFEIGYARTMIFGFLLYIIVLMYGQQVANALIEEKSSRLVEIILGAVTATEFMVGKLGGVLGAVVTQLAIWIGLGLLVGLYLVPAFIVGAEATGFDLMQFLDPTVLFYFALLYLLGFLFYTTLYAGVASTCTSTQELSQVGMVPMMPFIVSFMLMFYAMTNPSALAARILSLFPPFTPMLMIARVNTRMPPAWEFWLGVLLLLLATAAVAWLASKVFRFALLMHGKRPTFGEVYRLLRAA